MAIRSGARTGTMLVVGLLLAALLPPGGAVASAGPFDGDPASTARLHGRGAGSAGIEVSRARFAAGTAEVAVLSRDDRFPDALAGSGLTTRGPLLFSATADLTTRTRAELRRAVRPGGTVYLLGGTGALSESVARRVADDGYRVVRLGGRDRIETALAIADEVVRLGGSSARVLLARSEGTPRDETAGWADSVTAGGVAARDRTPVLLTATGGLDARVASWLSRRGVRETVLLGGAAALSDEVARALPGARRVGGAERTATAAAVARELWPSRTRLTVTSARHPEGWAHGLAAGGLAADAGAPLVLVERSVGPAVRALVASCGAPRIDLVVVGDGSVVPPRVRETLEAYDGGACGADGTLAFAAALATYDSCNEVLGSLRRTALERVGPYGLEGAVGFGEDTDDEATDGGAPVPAMPDGEETSGGGAPRSGTNTQEAGVDEPDIVKDDGRVALAVARGKLQVVDLTAAPPAVVASPALPPGHGHQLLLDGTAALVLAQRFDDDGRAVTTVTPVDLADPARPRTGTATQIDGVVRSARLVEGTVRLVVQSGPQGLDLRYPEDGSEEAAALAAEHNRGAVAAAPLSAWLPSYRVGDGPARQLVDCGDLARPPWEDGLSMLSVVSFPVDDPRPTSSAGVVARGDTVYASPTTLVVSTSRWRAGEVFLEGEPVTTELHAFDIADAGATRYLGSGSVPGHLLNSFSVSERDDRLRVATTTDPVWGPGGPERESESAVRVLERRGSAYAEVGAVGGLGLGERIFAVRFLGDVAAVVTFRQVDPLYLIDLADPTAPRVTGELKIPGFSSYLHPIGEDRLLGVGMDATDEGMTTGLQVSLFDISDLTDPRRVAQRTYPQTDSEVRHDHKAFLWWAPAGLAVVPVDSWTTGESAAVGIGVGPASLSERGRASHGSGRFDEQSRIRRAFVVGDAVYTVSERGIAAGRLADLGERSFTAFR